MDDKKIIKRLPLAAAGDNKAYLTHEARVINTEIGNDLAQARGVDTAQEFIKKTNKKMVVKGTAKAAIAKDEAAEFTTQLLKLTLQQHLQNDAMPDRINAFAEMFNDGLLDVGNAAQYSNTLVTGHDAYSVNDFIPNGITLPQIDGVSYIKFFTDETGAELTPHAYQNLKPLTILESSWFPYFISGKLSEFIANITANQAKTISLRKFDTLATMITTMPLPPENIITGKAPDMFAAFATEINGIIEDMALYSNKYAAHLKSRYIYELEKENIIMIVPVKLKSTLRMGIMSQLVKSKFFDIEQLVLPENILTLGNKINIGDSNTAITVNNLVPYCADDTIYIFDKKRLFKHLKVLTKNTSQQWTHNMALQIDIHDWGVFGTIIGGKMVKYTNPNLLKLPE